MVARKHNRSTGRRRFVQQRTEDADVLDCPSRLNLLSLEQVIIHCIDDNSNYTASGTNRLLELRREVVRQALSEISLVEKEWLGLAPRCLPQPAVGSEAGTR